MAALASQPHVGRGTGVVQPLHGPPQGAKMPYRATRARGAMETSREWLARRHVVIRPFFTVVLWHRAAAPSRPLLTYGTPRRASPRLASPHLTTLVRFFLLPFFSLFPGLLWLGDKIALAEAQG